MISKLTRSRIGDLITVSDETNKLGVDYPFYGVNINKEFMPTVANTSGLDKHKYKIIRKNRFVFSGMQTGRDKCIRISMYFEEKPVLVSPAYTTFEVTSPLVLPAYFFMIFKSKEKDRYGAFLSDSSVRANLDWNRFCDIELELPPIDIQRKYVAIYESLLSNLNDYESNLDDLRIVCDSFIEKLRKDAKAKLNGHLIESNERNELREAKSEKGVSIQKVFIDTKAKSSDVEKQKIVRTGFFAFNSNTSRNSDTISIALNNDEPCAVSNTYIVFKADDSLVPDYLYLWFKRKEFDRFARFNSWGSARETISLNEIGQYEISIPSKDIQKSVVSLLKVYDARVSFQKTLKSIISNICPVLIRGSILEAKGEKQNAN